MQIYLWRHNTQFSSWSMIDEPQIHSQRYTHAEVAVLAASADEARQLLAASGQWNPDELERIEPEVIGLKEPRIISSHVL
ncbi:hypothetical protein [Desulfogranum mediterraneum]|uniref:hypothetical protein n=1 Tax=Desulfogranum mediterraneum TaxID=160661 RepID=UPI00041E0CC0|nr:hypothetical protein [Desulfogranum mediterraneum]